MNIRFEDIFNDNNLNQAMEHLCSKRDGCGIDGVLISQFREYWKLNKEVILSKILDGTYVPDMIQEVEIVSYKGKKRTISKFTSTDRFLLRAVAQVVQPLCEAKLSKYCYSYRKGYGTLSAVQQAAKYIDEGYKWVAELDIEHFFDNIIISKMEFVLADILGERGTVFNFIQRYFYCRIENCGTVRTRSIGLIQGSLCRARHNPPYVELDVMPS